MFALAGYPRAVSLRQGPFNFICQSPRLAAARASTSAPDCIPYPRGSQADRQS